MLMESLGEQPSDSAEKPPHSSDLSLLPQGTSAPSDFPAALPLILQLGSSPWQNEVSGYAGLPSPCCLSSEAIHGVQT